MSCPICLTLATTCSCVATAWKTRCGVPPRPGQRLNLDATVAPDARAAAQVYPAAWWLNMIEPPADPEAQLEFALNMKTCYDLPSGREQGDQGDSARDAR